MNIFNGKFTYNGKILKITDSNNKSIKVSKLIVPVLKTLIKQLWVKLKAKIKARLA